MNTAEQLADKIENRPDNAIIYGDQAAAELRRLAAENERLQSDLQFVERWANHHATKPHVTAEQALSVIQHFPATKAITHGYADGKVPDTHDPYAENERLKDLLKSVLRYADCPEESSFYPHFSAVTNAARAAMKDTK